MTDTVHDDGFWTPERFRQANSAASTRGRLLLASCRAGAPLADAVRAEYEAQLAAAGAPASVEHLAGVDAHFSDTETSVHLPRDVTGRDVFVFQALYDPTRGQPVDANYMALLIAASALREWGARHVTAVLPYLAYARQDRPHPERREPATARLMANLKAAAGIERVLVWHPHSSRLHGYYDAVRLAALDACALFAEAFADLRGRADTVLVAPDLGAAELITQVGRALALDHAVAAKHRPRPEVAAVTSVAGSFEGKRVALVLDDMISSGGTVEALVRLLVEEKGIEAVHLGASHNLCLARAHARLLDLHARCGLRRLVVTDSIPQTPAFLELPFLEVRSLAPALSRAVNRIHYQRPGP